MQTALPFTAEQNRVRANLASYYAQWLELSLADAKLGPTLSWKTVSGRRYLYEITSSEGNARSLGAESPALIERYQNFVSSRETLRADLAEVDQRMAETARLYAALNLPMIDAAAAEVFRRCDLAGLMGTQLLAIGTNAMIAYEMEAGARLFMGFDATADCDLAFRGDVMQFTMASGRVMERTLFGVLKSIDSTYTVNTERSFQARNRKAFEVELLAAPSVIAKLPPGELVPLHDLTEQEWLLKGERIVQVVCGLDRKPTRIVCPDPRWMALHKAWLSQQAKRRSDKRSKDAEQAKRLWAAIRTLMPAFDVGEGFTSQLPDVLREQVKRLEAI